MKNMNGESGDQPAEGEKSKIQTPIKERKNLVIDEVSEPDKSESDSDNSNKSEGHSDGSGAANLKIDNSNQPMSGGATPRRSKEGNYDKQSARRSAHCVSVDPSTDPIEAKKQFANAIAQN